MNKEKAEKYSSSLANKYEILLQRFLETEPVNHLENILSRLSGRNQNKLYPVINEILTEFKKFEAETENADKWKVYNENILIDTDVFQQQNIQHFFVYNLLQFILVSGYTPLEEKYRSGLLKKYKLTPKKLKEQILQNFGFYSYKFEVKRGGSKSEMSERQNAKFLADYNRYQIIIKNVRKEKTILQKKFKNSDISAKKEALQKYEIPIRLLNSAFSYDSPSEVALDWAMEISKIGISRDYAKQILNKTRKNFRRFFLVNIEYFRSSKRMYGFNLNDKEKAALLRYNPPTLKNEEIIGSKDSFFIEAHF